MFDENSIYDNGVNTYSPDGRIYQIEYAINASKLGSSGLGIACQDGVVLVAEKKVASRLVERSGFEKVSVIDTHIMCLVSGLIADAQQLLGVARSEACHHKFIYDQPIDIKPLTQTVADMALNFGEGDITTKTKPNARPFGVSMLFAGVDESGPTIFETAPSGTMVGYLAKGVGQAKEAIQGLLEKHYNGQMQINQAKQLGISIIKQVMEERISTDTVEMFFIDNQTQKFYKAQPEELQSLINSAADMSS